MVLHPPSLFTLFFSLFFFFSEREVINILLCPEDLA